MSVRGLDGLRIDRLLSEVARRARAREQVQRLKAGARVALALRVIAERLEHREAPAEFLNVTFKAA